MVLLLLGDVPAGLYPRRSPRASRRSNQLVRVLVQRVHNATLGCSSTVRATGSTRATRSSGRGDARTPAAAFHRVPVRNKPPPAAADLVRSSSLGRARGSR